MALPFQANLFNLWLLVFAVYFGRFCKQNYWLWNNGTFGEPLPSSEEFQVYTHHDVLDHVLHRYQTELGKDDERYRHHCLRVLSFAVYQLQHERQEQARKQRQLERRLPREQEQQKQQHEQEQDQQQTPQEDKKSPKKGLTADARADEFSKEGTVASTPPHNLVPGSDVDLMAWALAYHDIALWTDGKLNYLDPSMIVMERDLEQLIASTEGTKSADMDVTIEDRIVQLFAANESNLATAREIILQHHKVMQWHPPKQDSPTSTAVTVAKADVVNAVRKADWADATMGLIRFGLPGTYLEAAYVQVPPMGFHVMLLQMGSRLSPHSLIGQLDVLRILKL